MLLRPGRPCPVYLITHPRCRKPAPCRVCRQLIAKGEEYERHSYVHERGDPDAKPWRDLYAGVLRRGLGRRFIAIRRECLDHS